MAWRFLTLLTFAAMALMGAAQAEPTKPGGIYVIVDAASPAQYDLVRETMARPDVDGLLIHLHWNDVNPLPGMYDWKALNATVAIATEAHKRFEIGIVTGKQTPGWVVGEATQKGWFSYNAAMSNSGGDGCGAFEMAVPWDPSYLASFRALLHGLRQNLLEKGTYKHLAMLKLFGVTTTTNELRLPTVMAPGCTIGKYNPLVVWQGLHYKPSKVEGAWLEMLAMYRSEFPEKAFNIGFIGKNAFPGIMEDGNILASERGREALSARFTQKLIDEAADVFHSRLALGFDSLTLINKAPSYTAYLAAFDVAAREAKIPIGWQTNELLGNYPYGGASCRGNEPVKTGGAGGNIGSDGNPTVPCESSAEFRTMLTTATGIGPHGPVGGLRSVYLEVFPQNLAMYPAALPGVREMLAPWGGGP